METVSEIAYRLGIPWTDAAKQYTPGEPPPPKPIRKRGYTKKDIAAYLPELDKAKSVNAFAKEKNLHAEVLKNALSQHAPLWWAEYCKDRDIRSCPNCSKQFYAAPNQIYCSTVCGTRHRINLDYFGGDRASTIGMTERVCQLCARQEVAGLSSHHILGKENDPENKHLVALCRGCHQVVTLLGARNFTEAQWAGLISLATIRKTGSCPAVKVCKG
jgi:hypothetical protein